MNDYLTGLNSKQREAVEYGIKPEKTNDIGPLLVIAGAGSGKTNTLAHRVAHLVANGADPHGILLLTFSRRAAREMTQRVRRIASSVLKSQKVHLPWSGTFHAIGARLLREYAQVIGLKPSFTIHDRSDSADLMNLVRHDLEQSKKQSRFPQKDTCAAIYSLAVNSGAPLERILVHSVFHGAPNGRTSSGSCSPNTPRPSGDRTCSITMICSCTGRKC